MIRPFLLLVSLLLSAAALFPQAQVSSGDIRGQVVDSSGSAISGASVTVSDPARGTSRHAMSDNEGSFSFPTLPPGTYKMRIEAQGFSTKLVDGVELRVGDAVVQRIAMEVGAVTTEVTVQAESAVVEIERTQQASTLESQRIRNLPINRRNYLDFALLTPGVVESTSLVDGTDFRVVQTPQSGLSFGGGNGRGNAFTVDGVENYVNSGGVRPSVSQEAVQEFQVNRNTFAAEVGGSMGGALNIVTKSGTNDVHGNFFGFLRNRSIQARNYFDPGKSAYTRGQYGATFGAAVKKDRTFIFAAYERLDRHETIFVPILPNETPLQVLTPSQQQLVNFFDNAPVADLRQIAAQMRGALTTTNFPSTVALFRRNTGRFPFSEDNNMVSLKLDHRFSDRHNAFLRGNLTKGFSNNAQFGALEGYNRGRNLDQFDGTVMLADTFVINPRWISETRAMFANSSLNVIPTDKLGPQIDISGFGNFGRQIFLPSKTIERHGQITQTFTMSSAKHILKFGGDINPASSTVRSETFFGGRFFFGDVVPLGLVLNTATQNPAFSAQLASLLNLLGQSRLIPNLSQPLTALQAYNLGIPTIYQQGFGDPNWQGTFGRYNFFVQDSFKLTPRLTLNYGMRYELETKPKPIPADNNNVAGRFGFAWTPGSGGKTVIRGGYGLFYAPIWAQVAALPATLDGSVIAQSVLTLRGIPGLNNPRTGQPLLTSDVYQTLAAQGVIGRRTITIQDIAQFGLRPGPNAPGRVIFDINKDFRNPYSQQASFEIERAIGTFAVSVSYMFNRGARITRNLDYNLFYSGRTPGPQSQPIFGFKNPAISQYNVLESTANSFYHAGVLQVQKRYSKHFALNAHYTFSKAIDEVTDFNSDYQPHDQLNARADRALSSFNQSHRFVGSAIFDSGWKSGKSRSFHENLFGDWTVAPIVVLGSARPFNIVAGFDNLGDNHPTTHRPFGAGRNIGIGPNSYTWDLRLTRKFNLSGDGKRNLEFLAEGFNLLNRTNFRTVNNVVGAASLSDLPRPLTGRRDIPTNPFAFTGANDPRQFQFGIKINY